MIIGMAGKRIRTFSKCFDEIYFAFHRNLVKRGEFWAGSRF